MTLDGVQLNHKRTKITKNILKLNINVTILKLIDSSLHYTTVILVVIGSSLYGGDRGVWSGRIMADWSTNLEQYFERCSQGKIWDHDSV